jgi:DNA-binding transcriptional LysR family regulator
MSLRSHAQLEGLRRHTLDVGFTYAAPPADDTLLQGAVAREERLLLALPPGDPLTESGRVTPADLDGTTWITVVRQPNDTNRDAFVAACAQAGFVPNIAYETTDPLTSLGLVSAGLGYAVVQASLKTIAPPDVSFRQLPWFGRRVTIHLLWRRTDGRPAIAAFRDAVLQSPR